MKNLLVLLFFVFSFSYVKAQSFNDKFLQAFNERDTLSQRRVLDTWERDGDLSAEFYIAKFNYFFNKAIGIANENGGINQEVKDILESCFNSIDKGIEKYPNRLDMHFGKISAYKMICDFSSYTRCIKETIAYSKVNNNKWLWEDDSKIKKGKEFLLSSIQDYQTDIYDMEDMELLDYMKEIAECVLKYYPDHIESMSNMSIVYMYKEEYEKALTYLLKAYELNKKDGVVLSNIAYAYNMKGDKENAKKYYRLVAKYGDKDMKAFAKDRLREL